MNNIIKRQDEKITKQNLHDHPDERVARSPSIIIRPTLKQKTTASLTLLKLYQQQLQTKKDKRHNSS